MKNPRDIEMEIYDEMYKDMERQVQVKVLDEHGHQVGDAAMMTEHEVGVLYETIPHNWSIEEV